MIRLVLSCLIFSASLVAHAFEPVLEPLPHAFDGFQKSCLSTCDDLLASIRSRMGEPKDKRVFERFERELGLYRNNLHGDILEAQQALALPKDPSALPFALHKICTDLTGFRRSLDALLIEAVAAKSITIDEALLVNLRRFWDYEYYNTWRFGSEIAPIPH